MGPTVASYSLRSAFVLYLLRRTGGLKVGIGVYFSFNVTEKSNWPESKSENSSSDQISFQFHILVSLSALPLTAPGLHPEVRSILDFFRRRIEDMTEPLCVAGAAVLPPLNLRAVC